MKKFFLSFLLLLAAGAGGASVTALATEPQQAYTLEITPETSERWWGIDLMGRAWNVYQKDEYRSSWGSFTTNMLISNTGRYVFSAEPFAVSCGGNGAMTIESHHEKVEVRKSGSTLREAYLMCVHRHMSGERTMPSVGLFTQPVYRPGLRPDITWGADEIVAFARRTVAEGSPTGIIVIPEGWASPHRLLGFDRELFPDLPAMLGELREMGFKVMLTVTPSLPVGGRAFSDAYRNRWLNGEDGLDIGKDAAFTHFHERVAQLVAETGFDGYVFDSRCLATGRELWATLADGVDMCIVNGTNTRPFAPYASKIGCDSCSASATEHLLAASLSGDIYKVSSVGMMCGNEREKAAWTVLSLFSPVAAVDSTVWDFEDEGLRNRVRAALQLRASMAEYMETTVRESAKTGEPIVQHMEYRFPKQGFSDCDDQFMLGSRYLIAPSLDGAAKRMVRLPRGRWRTADGRTLRGPLVLEADCSTAGIAYFEFVR